MISAESQRQDIERLRRLEVNTHLVKPVGAGDLADALALAESGGEVGLAPFALEEVEAGAGKVMDILLVEDNPVNQELARRLLERHAHRVTVANNGVEALEQFDSQHFDVILMDMQMPVMGGLEATETIRSREMRRSWVISENFRPVYIVAMTANVLASDRQRCREAGMNDYLAKPLRPAELEAALARACSEDVAEPVADRRQVESTAPGLDLRAALRDIGDVDLFATMVGMLLAEWDEHLARVSKALADGDANDLRMHAHTLKSLLAMFHAEAGRRQAMALEAAAMDPATVDWRKSQQVFAVLQGEMERIKPLLKQFVDTHVIP
jgi:protein-histidine pros-kinase